MPRLEYRLLDKSQNYPILYYYDKITKEEIAIRFAVDYLVTDGLVLEKTSAAIEPPAYVIYCVSTKNESTNDSTPAGLLSGFTLLEIRKFKEGCAQYPLLKVIELADQEELTIFLLSNYLTLDGVEWEKTSSEIDEDRKTYVIYVQEPQEE